MTDNTATTPATNEQSQAQNSRLFNPNEHLMQIKNRGGSADYLPVQWRLVWFRSLFPQGTIETEIVHLDLDRQTEEETYQWNNETRRSEKIVKRAPGFAVFRATVRDGLGGVATGTKSEKAASFADFMEKAETGAIGRALAALGYGTQFTGDEFDEKHRIVDAPVDHGNGASATAGNNGNTNRAKSSNTAKTQGKPAVAEPDPTGPVSERQRQRIGELCKQLGGKKVALPANHLAAEELIGSLEQEYRRQQQVAS